MHADKGAWKTNQRMEGMRRCDGPLLTWTNFAQNHCYVCCNANESTDVVAGACLGVASLWVAWLPERVWNHVVGGVWMTDFCRHLRGGFLFTLNQPTSSLFQNLTIISVWSFMMNIGFTFYCLREEISIWNSNLYFSYDEEWGRFALLKKAKKKDAAMACLWLFLLLASLRHDSFNFFWKASAAQS